MTEFEVWHRHKNNITSNFKENDRTIWGDRLEAAIAKGIAKDNKWNVIPKKEYMRREDIRAGSSFDYAIVDLIKNEEGKMIGWTETSLLEIKNVDSLVFKERWDIQDGELVEAPPHIELQVQHQLMVSGIDKAYIGALIGGNKIKLIERSRDEEIISAIEKKIKDFWKSIEENREPTPDFEKDADFIARLYSHSEPDTTIASTNEINALAEAYKAASEKEKEFTTEKKSIKAQLLTLIGDNEKVLGDGFSISAGMIAPKMVEAYERKGYRNFKVNFRKKKENK